MLATLSYQEEHTRKQIQIPYYEIQNIAQEIYEKDKQRKEFDFDSFEQQYTYFKPYLDYLLLQKQGRLDHFLMDPNNHIYAENQTLWYHSNNGTRLHEKTNQVPYLCADDNSIMLNQRNINFSSLLLNDATSLSYKEAKHHDLTIDFYIHQIISQNKEIATHYKMWKQQEPSGEMDLNRKYVLCYLGSFLFIDLGDIIWYIKSEGTETVAQTNWVSQTSAQLVRGYKPTCEEMIVAKQFTKAIS